MWHRVVRLGVRDHLTSLTHPAGTRRNNKRLHHVTTTSSTSPWRSEDAITASSLRYAPAGPGIHAHSHWHQTAIASTLWLSAAPEVVTMTTPSAAGNHTVATATACLRGTYMKYRYIHTIINKYMSIQWSGVHTRVYHKNTWYMYIYISTYTRSCIRWTCHHRMHRKLSRRQHPVHPATIIPHKKGHLAQLKAYMNAPKRLYIYHVCRELSKLSVSNCTICPISTSLFDRKFPVEFRSW